MRMRRSPRFFPFSPEWGYTRYAAIMCVSRREGTIRFASAPAIE